MKLFLPFLFVWFLCELSFAQNCQVPATCSPPHARHFRIMPVPSRNQWAFNGGYCGALSIQSIALSHGIYISQKVVRQAAPQGGGHGNATDGYEILHTNIDTALTKLKLNYNKWSWETQPQPQYGAYLAWLKKELIEGHPVVWFIMCSGDGHDSYGIGHYDHIEPVFGIFSNHSLSDLRVYDDDWLVHGSDWDQNRYYRPFNSLVDNPTDGKVLTGNCSRAVPHGGGPNEAYPCLMNLTDYGWSIIGPVDPLHRTIPTSLSISGNGQEPLTSSPLTATIHVLGPLVVGSSYVTYRFDGTENFPTNSDFENSKYSSAAKFQAHSHTHQFVDSVAIDSGSAVYYVTVPYN